MQGRLANATKFFREWITSNFEIDQERLNSLYIDIVVLEEKDTLLGKKFIAQFSMKYKDISIHSFKMDLIDGESPDENELESLFLTTFYKEEESTLYKAQEFLSGDSLQARRMETCIRTLYHYWKKEEEKLFDDTVFAQIHERYKLNAIALKDAFLVMKSIQEYENQKEN